MFADATHQLLNFVVVYALHSHVFIGGSSSKAMPLCETIQHHTRTLTFNLSFFLISPPTLLSEMPSYTKRHNWQIKGILVFLVDLSRTLPVKFFFTSFFFKNFFKEESRSPATRDVAAARACVCIQTTKKKRQHTNRRFSRPTSPNSRLLCP